MPIQSASRKQPIDPYVHCVVLSSFQAEFTYLQNIFRLTGIRMHHADSLDEADFLLTATDSTVCLVDAIFAGGSWQTALSLLTGSHPLVTTLVIADPVDRPFLKDLFLRGACGIIWKPFQFEAARRLIRAVHEASKERRAFRDEILSRGLRSGGRPSIAPVTEEPRIG